MAVLTEVTIVTDHLEKRTLRFMTVKPYRLTVLRILSIMRAHADNNGNLCDVDSAARRVYSELPHYAEFPGEPVDTEFHVCVNFHDFATFFGHNEDKASWGNVHFGGCVGHTNWDAGNDSTGYDWLILMER